MVHIKIYQIIRNEGFLSLLLRTCKMLLRKRSIILQELVARYTGTYSKSIYSEKLKLSSLINSKPCRRYNLEDCIPQTVCAFYLDHRFDLLGSGWVQLRYGMKCRGVAGHRFDSREVIIHDTQGKWLEGRLNASNLIDAQFIWQRIDTKYQPIDWQLDFKSGYRWSEKIWSANLSFGHITGVDVKVPWELSRMQHLPQLALRAGASDLKNTHKLILVREIRNQILDFIATNPPGFGVNWICPMDISIRGANWCLALHLLKSIGVLYEDDDEEIFICSLRDHARYIVRHLEWSEERANHYLADIAGLIFIAAYLPENNETDCWLSFAIGQLQDETLRQFFSDGGNFEGSTGYHRLSAEMIIYSTGVILGLSFERQKKLTNLDPKLYDYLPWYSNKLNKLKLNPNAKNERGEVVHTLFCDDFVKRLNSLIIFFSGILKNNGNFPLIGDHDSGRFFKIQPLFFEIKVASARGKYINLQNYYDLNDNDIYYFENVAYGVDLLKMATSLGLFVNEKISENFTHFFKVAQSSAIISEFSSGIKFFKTLKITPLRKLLYSKAETFPGFDFYRNLKLIKSKPKVVSYSYEILNVGKPFLFKISSYFFPEFGCFIFRSYNIYLFIRCVTKSGQIIGPHCHHDQLSIELEINNVSLIQDPGSYNYTAFHDQNSKYRSSNVHFSPLQLTSSLKFNSDLYKKFYYVPAEVEYFGNLGFCATIKQDSFHVGLIIHFKKTKISIFFFSDNKIENTKLENLESVPYSPGYGIQQTNFT
jgi:hypothetical protein